LQTISNGPQPEQLRNESEYFKTDCICELPEKISNTWRTISVVNATAYVALGWCNLAGLFERGGRGGGLTKDRVLALQLEGGLKIVATDNAK